VAHRLEVGATSSRIAAVHYRTWDDGIVEDRSARGRVVVLAGHGIETPRLLLNSHWRTGARGSPISVANSSGQVGRNLMDHLIVLAWGLSTDPVYPYRGPLSTSGIDSFRDGDDRRRRSAFRIEVGNDGWSWPAASPYTLLYELAARRKMRGPALRAALRDHLVREIRMAAELEMLPRSDNRVRLSGHLVDRLGIPRPEVEFDVSVYEKAAMAEARAALHGILSLFGMRSLDTSDPPHKAARVEHRGAHYEYRGAGHIMGTHRMGTDPADSVTDSFGRSHDHSNLFILGSGAFPSSGTANPTLTTVALTLRSISEIDSASVVSDESTTEGANDV
jgi:choline dehydrogenase-like flavoprotein